MTDDTSSQILHVVRIRRNSTLAALIAERDWIMGLLNVPGVEVDQVPEGLGEFLYRTPSGLYRVKVELMTEEGPQ